jgi:hypothetical protein
MPARRIMSAGGGSVGVAQPSMAAANSRPMMSPRGMIMAGNTEVSPSSMKGETFSGRSANLACKKAFKSGAFCERD